MRKLIKIGLVFLMGVIVSGCGSSLVTKKVEQVRPAFIIKSNEPIAIMPFETESALSNFGGQLSDEIIVNILEHAPRLKLIPATVVRNYLLNANLGISGLPDAHTIHNLREGLKCRYLLTGNLYTSIGEVRYTQSYSSRIASGSVTVRLVDCDSLNVVWAKHVEDTFTTTTYYYSGGQQQTAYFTDGQLLQGLVRRLSQDVARNFYED
ncbi:MAG: hypothetical protein AABZ61_00015 [Bacteroidota bacterium]